jgi:hypothetical protein
MTDTQADIAAMLKQQIETWEIIGHQALLERFVYRNGKVFSAVKRIGTKREAKACFMNASHHVIRRGGSYVEGYVMNKKLNWLFHHAWVTTTGLDAMDPTLHSKHYEYFGVEFTTDTLRKELVRNEVYGILDPGLGLNTRLMFAIDPELEAICHSIMQRRKERVC